MKLSKKTLQVYVDRTIVNLWGDQKAVRLMDKKEEELIESKIEGLQQLREVFFKERLEDVPDNLPDLPTDDDDDDEEVEDEEDKTTDPKGKRARR